MRLHTITCIREPESRSEPARAIGDYAIVGDCRSAALTSRTGSLDWLCWPRFESPCCFGALLDAEGGGCFAISPALLAHVFYGTILGAFYSLS
jgi:GH15 family glucan-1,4-alpha-glucosidase